MLKEETKITKESDAEKKVNHLAVIAPAVLNFPDEMPDNERKALIDLAVGGHTEEKAAFRNNLNRDRVHYLTMKYSKEVKDLKLARNMVLGSLVEGVVYNLVNMGLESSANIKPDSIETPSALSSLANAAQIFQSLAERIKEQGKEIPKGAIRQNRKALQDAVKELDSIPDSTE